MTAKKGIGFLLILSLLLAVSAIFTASAAEITVDIVSFTRGAQEDLRSSELLEARVEGYDGNVRELTYKWTSTIGTYLYVYNSHNMYGINNTDGEIEIYNSNVSASANMSGRSYRNSFSGVGYAWASIYGANLSASDLVGKITVEVYDKDGTLLASDTHEGTRERTGGSFFRPTYTYKGFVTSNLADDVSNVYFGLFEGDTKNVKILLGESSIVHITCVECSISNPTVVSGAETIEIVVDNETQEAHIKSISGTSNGEAKVQITIKKGNCKFHQNVSTTRTIEVYVYKKPTTTSTATAIMLDNLDDRCTYYIGGVAGVRQTVDGKEYVVFEGLTPNTQYQIEVVGQANEKTDPVYAYVYETTKPAHTGTIEVILNGTYDSSTGTAFGERVDITSVMPNVETIYLRYEDSEIYFPLEKVSTGVYTSVLSNGNYTVYYSESGSTAKVKLGDQVLTVDNASRTRALFFNSVTYDVAGGVPTVPTEYYLVDSKVTVTETVPEKEGFLFTHWTDGAGNSYKSGATLVEEIGEAHTLTAQYVVSADVYVNIVIKHIDKEGGGHNNDRGMHDITFTVDQRFGGTGDYAELISKTIDWDGVSAFEDAAFTAKYVNSDSEHKDRTIYTAVAPVLVNVAKDAEYTFTTAKSGYELTSVTSRLDENGDWQIDAELVFAPNEFDFTYTVKLDEQSMLVANDLKPAAVNVKVTAWGDTPYDDADVVSWCTISQHKETYERIVLDENGVGRGTYPVWKTTTDTETPYAYRIEVVSYETADGTILPAFDKNGEHTTYATEQNRYSAAIVVIDGKVPNGSTLAGAWYENDRQNGTVEAIVTIEVFDVTFDPNGGVLNGSEDDTVLHYQIGIPNLAEYVPAREGGYVFDGWYLADANGDMTEEKAVSDTIIFENTTLVAKWRDPLTVQGQVAVDGTYYDHDRASHVVVLLQRIDANGYAETVLTETVTLTYGEEHGIGSYSFTEIPDVGHSYRIKTVTSNYHTHYLNETVDIAVEDYDAYLEETEDDMYLAVFAGDSVANVHLHLHFMPENFDLAYAVDASAIGEGFRPASAEVLVLCDTGVHIDPQHWDVISQMIEDGVPNGNEILLTDGKGEGSEPVWQIKADGATPYDYSIRVDSLTFGGEVNPYGDEIPYAIYYNGSARYGEVNGQTQTLVATVVPRMYSITFELGENMEEVEIDGMEKYLTVGGTFEDTYYWSYGKAVTAEPSAEGYTFLGWYDADGTKVTTVAADSAADVTLYAKWVVTPEFVTLVDAGYYSVARDSETKEGIIALNARISNYDAVKDHIEAFGIYIYDTTGTVVSITASSANMEQLAKDSGEYHVTVSGIAPAGFAAKVLAAPYVVVDGEIVIGETMTGSVAAINKWLGEK